MILAAAVVFRAPKKDRPVTEGMTRCDVDLTSRAQYIAMQMDKNSALGRFGEHKTSLSK